MIVKFVGRCICLKDFQYEFVSGRKAIFDKNKIYNYCVVDDVFNVESYEGFYVPLYKKEEIFIDIVKYREDKLKDILEC